MLTFKKQKKHVCLVKWRSRIEQAKINKSFTSEDKMDAMNWNVCAVGEGQKYLNNTIRKLAFKAGGRCGYISFSQIAPVDKRLEELGCQFSSQVSDDRIGYASRTLDAIEKRLNQLYVLA
ncbi:MAG TPA: hypothetical protein VNX68_11225 [Nitrosopumilaceae archaeon]|jgi:hypothetical protein|nr:hypothetical protein [Nitrosopumilaceae archaeon]